MSLQSDYVNANCDPDDDSYIQSLDCPMCGERAFTIDPQDGSKGYCSAEGKTWVIRPGASLLDFIDDDGDYRYRHEPDDLNQCDCGDTLNVYGVCPACQM